MSDASVAENKANHIPWLLKPGEIVCNWFGVEDPDSRILLRMFVNLTLYSKIGGSIAFMFL